MIQAKRIFNYMSSGKWVLHVNGSDEYSKCVPSRIDDSVRIKKCLYIAQEFQFRGKLSGIIYETNFPNTDNYKCV